MKIEKSIMLLCLILCFAIMLSACDTAEPEASAETKAETVAETEVSKADDIPKEYADLLNSLVSSITWDEDAEFSELYWLSDMYTKKSGLSEVGFALMDVDGDGQEELIVSGIDSPFIYDLFTVKGGEVVSLFSSAERNSYCLYENGYIENTWLGSSASFGNEYYQLDSGEMKLVEKVWCDADLALEIGLIDEINEANDENTFFKSDSADGETYVHISFDEALEILDSYENSLIPLSIEYTPLSEYSSIS